MTVIRAHVRARDLGIPFMGKPGPLNAITDVAGVEVGHTTLIRGSNVRTGVTTVLPRGKAYDPCFAGWYALNGNGEMTGTTWLDESGFIETPIAITNTHSVGVVRDAMVSWHAQRGLTDPIAPGIFWMLPVVAETYDGVLNDINGMHVKARHVWAALDNAAGGAVVEGSVGGGTGMNCYEFKGGIGTSSRIAKIARKNYTVGVLLQANFGSRHQLTVAGVPLGAAFDDTPSFRHLVSAPVPKPIEAGSVIVVIATDAPLLPHQLKRLARRVPLGLARTGNTGGNSSGDIFIAFSTANAGAAMRAGSRSVNMLPNDEMDALFEGVVYGVEEAVINALIAARTMTGQSGRVSHALPHEKLVALLQKRGVIK
jgi:D-aminopeptidase